MTEEQAKEQAKLVIDDALKELFRRGIDMENARKVLIAWDLLKK